MNKLYLKKIIVLVIFIISFFFLTAIYTYLFARIQNTTIFFKFIDIIHMPLLPPISSLAWLISLPILLITYYKIFYSYIFKNYTL